MTGSVQSAETCSLAGFDQAAPATFSVGLPNGVELAVSLDFADQHRLGQVMVRQGPWQCRPSGSALQADNRGQHGVSIGRAGLFDSLDPELEAQIGRFHRVVGGALVVLDELVPALMNSALAGVSTDWK